MAVSFDQFQKLEARMSFSLPPQGRIVDIVGARDRDPLGRVLTIEYFPGRPDKFDIYFRKEKPCRKGAICDLVTGDEIPELNDPKTDYLPLL